MSDPNPLGREWSIHQCVACGKLAADDQQQRQSGREDETCNDLRQAEGIMLQFKDSSIVAAISASEVLCPVACQAYTKRPQIDRRGALGKLV